MKAIVTILNDAYSVPPNVARRGWGSTIRWFIRFTIRMKLQKINTSVTTVVSHSFMVHIPSCLLWCPMSIWCTNNVKHHGLSQVAGCAHTLSQTACGIDHFGFVHMHMIWYSSSLFVRTVVFIRKRNEDGRVRSFAINNVVSFTVSANGWEVKCLEGRLTDEQTSKRTGEQTYFNITNL